MTENWKASHPFAIGDQIYAREDHVLQSFGRVLRPGHAYTVRMRGADDHGLWVAVHDVSEHLPIHLFTDQRMPAMPPVTDSSGAE